MSSTGEEIEENCKLVRDIIVRQKTKREETILRFEELFEQWKRRGVNRANPSRT